MRDPNGRCLQGLVGKSTREQLDSAMLLHELGPTAVEWAAKQLTAILRRSDYEDAGAARGLGALGADAGLDAGAALITALQMSTKNSVRHAAATSLGDLGPAAGGHAALEVLRATVRKDPNVSVRERAAEAVKKIEEAAMVRVVTCNASVDEAQGYILVSCAGLTGAQLAVIRCQPDSMVADLRADLAESLGIAAFLLRLVTPGAEASILEDTEPIARLTELS